MSNANSNPKTKAKPHLVLYLGVVSPFAYLAFYVVSTSSVFKDCSIEYVPVLLRGILAACGNKGPTAIESKAKWTNKDRLCWSRLFKVPMAEQMPPGFPASTLFIDRALTAVCSLYPDRIKDCYARIFHDSFANRLDVNDRQVLESILTDVLGQTAGSEPEQGKAKAAEILSRAESDEVKAMLKSKTDEVVASGAFGLPWFEATNIEGETEYFWGFDHLGQVTRHLGLDALRPDTGNAVEDAGGWRAIL